MSTDRYLSHAVPALYQHHHSTATYLGTYLPRHSRGSVFPLSQCSCSAWTPEAATDCRLGALQIWETRSAVGTTKTKARRLVFVFFWGPFRLPIASPKPFFGGSLGRPTTYLGTQVSTVGTYLLTYLLGTVRTSTTLHTLLLTSPPASFSACPFFIWHFFPSSPGPPLPTPPSRFGSRRNTYLFAPSSRQPGSFKAFRRLLEILQRPAGSLSPPATLLCRPFSCTRQQPPRQPARDTPATGKRGVSAHHSRYVPQQSLLCLHAFPDSCVLRFVCIRGQRCPA